MSIFETIQKFVKASSQPVVMEPGDDPIALAPDSFALTARGAMVTLECWNQSRNLVRRVRSIREERRGRLELEVERFGASTGTLMLVDMSDPGNRDAGRRGSRLKYRERFRRSLRRQYPDWRITELSTEPDLQHSLSPSYPRALLRKGGLGIAAIGAAEDSLSPEGVLSFGLIWLDYLKRREARVAVEALAIFVPQAAAATTCHRVRYLDGARFSVFVHDPGGHEDPVDPGDYTNFETRLDAFPGGPAEHPWVKQLVSIDGVEQRAMGDGSVSLAVRGLEFARASASELKFGIDQKQAAGASNLGEIEELARGLDRMRRVSAADRQNPLYLRHPGSVARIAGAAGDRADWTRSFCPAPIYGQVPQFAAGERGVMDLLAADRDARLAVIEVKAVGGHSSAAAGAGLLDAREVAPGSRRVFRARVFSGDRAGAGDRPG